MKSEKDLMPIHSRIGYHSMHGIWQKGIVIGYGYISSPDTIDIYLIEIEPGGKGLCLPLGKVVGIELDRVVLCK